VANRRVVVAWLAVAVAVTGIVVALALPMHTCAWGHLEELSGPGIPEGELICIRSDLGYQPSSWLPTKIAVATGGIVAGVALVLASRRHGLAAAALVVLFAAVTVAWFLPNGFDQPLRGGRPVCCGREVDRHDVRVGLVASGVMAAVVLLAMDAIRRTRDRGITPAEAG
jgi:hypothetical protein